jgi:hypothetical protein
MTKDALRIRAMPKDPSEHTRIPNADNRNRPHLRRILATAVMLAVLASVVSLAPVPADVDADPAPTSGTCGEGVIWEYSESWRTLQIKKDYNQPKESGKMQDYGPGEAPWKDFKMDQAGIGPDVISIGDCAFYGCNIGSFGIGGNVKTIGERAFYGSTLASIDITAGVTTIGEQAFGNCDDLTSLVFNQDTKVTTIGTGAFSGCSSLTSVTFPSTVTSIGDSAFYGTGLTSLTIPDNVITAGDKAFASCPGLTSVTLGSGLTSISDEMFSSAGLTSLTIPGTVTAIGQKAFYGCDDLTSITFGSASRPWRPIRSPSDSTTIPDRSPTHRS